MGHVFRIKPSDFFVVCGIKKSLYLYTLFHPAIGDNPPPLSPIYLPEPPFTPSYGVISRFNFDFPHFHNLYYDYYI